MFGKFFLIGQQIGLQRAVLFRGGPAFAGAGDGAHGDFAIAQAHQNFGAGPDHLKAAEVEEEQEGRGVGAAQAAVQREGRQGKALRPALAGHHLKDVARADIVPGLFHGGLVAVFGKV
jgi:hypothetical protein